MKKYETYKIYGKKRKISDNYYEVQFTEYRSDGTKIRKGSEDFSRERLQAQTKLIEIYIPSGKVMHGTREGWKMTACIDTLRVSKNAVAISAARKFYPNVVRVVII